VPTTTTAAISHLFADVVPAMSHTTPRSRSSDRSPIA
jgi:hypothetical protein